MKKLTLIAAALLLGAAAWGQNPFGNIVGSLASGASKVYTAKTGLDGAYNYNGIAVTLGKADGDIVSNLSGTAVTAGVETQIDAVLAKVGIKPGAMTITFNAADNSFVLNVAGVPIEGTYKVGDYEKTVNLNFGKGLQFFNITGSLENSLGTTRIVFPADGAIALFKKIADKIGSSSKEISSIAKMVEGYDSFKIGLKLSK